MESFFFKVSIAAWGSLMDYRISELRIKVLKEWNNEPLKINPLIRNSKIRQLNILSRQQNLPGFRNISCIQ